MTCTCPEGFFGNAEVECKETPPCPTERGFELINNKCVCPTERGKAIDKYGNCIVCPIGQGLTINEEGQCFVHQIVVSKLILKEIVFVQHRLMKFEMEFVYQFQLHHLLNASQTWNALMMKYALTTNALKCAE